MAKDESGNGLLDTDGASDQDIGENEERECKYDANDDADQNACCWAHAPTIARRCL